VTWLLTGTLGGTALKVLRKIADGRRAAPATRWKLFFIWQAANPATCTTATSSPPRPFSRRAAALGTQHTTVIRKTP
jgi:hypothetical protein